MSEFPVYNTVAVRQRSASMAAAFYSERLDGEGNDGTDDRSDTDAAANALVGALLETTPAQKDWSGNGNGDHTLHYPTNALQQSCHCSSACLRLRVPGWVLRFHVANELA